VCTGDDDPKFWWTNFHGVPPHQKKNAERPVVLWFFLFSFDATAQQWPDGFSPNVHKKDIRAVLFVKIGPQNFESPKHPFLAKIQRPPTSDGCCMETRRNSGKTKTLLYCQYLGYPNIHIWWNSVQVLLSYKTLVVHLPMAHSISFDWQYLKNGNTCRITSLSLAESLKFGLSCGVAVLGMIPPIFKINRICF